MTAITTQDLDEFVNLLHKLAENRDETSEASDKLFKARIFLAKKEGQLLESESGLPGIGVELGTISTIPPLVDVFLTMMLFMQHGDVTLFKERWIGLMDGLLNHTMNVADYE